MSTERISAQQAIAWARAHGAVPHLVDGTTLRNAEQTMDAIGEALSFPEQFGRDLDALYGCLADLSWLPDGKHVLVWARHQVLAEHDWPAYLQVRTVLERGVVSGTRRRLTVVLTPN